MSYPSFSGRGLSGCLLAALLGLAPLAVQASPELECSAEGGSQVEIGDCLAGVEKSVDASVAAALDIAMTSATDLDNATGRAEAAPALTAAQEAWSAYRDRQCDFVGASFGGGSGTGIAILSCRIMLGRDRADELVNAAN